MKLKNVVLSLALVVFAFSGSSAQASNSLKNHSTADLFELLRTREDNLGYNALQLTREPANSMWVDGARQDSKLVKEVNDEIKRRGISNEDQQKARSQAQASFEEDAVNPVDKLVDLDDAEFALKKDEVSGTLNFTGEFAPAAQAYYNKLKKQIDDAQKIRTAQAIPNKADQEARIAKNKALVEAKGLNTKNAPTLIHKLEKRQAEYKKGTSKIMIEPLSLVQDFNDSLIAFEETGKKDTDARHAMFGNAGEIFMYIILGGSDKASDKDKMNVELKKVLTLNGFNTKEVEAAQHQAAIDARAAQSNPKIMKK